MTTLGAIAEQERMKGKNYLDPSGENQTENAKGPDKIRDFVKKARA